MSRLTKEEEENFEEAHIKAIWNELHERFGFNLKGWKPKFDAFYEKQTRDVSPMSAFYRFGYTYINPILNEILVRRVQTPTFNNLVKYVITKKSQPIKK